MPRVSKRILDPLGLLKLLSANQGKAELVLLLTSPGLLTETLLGHCWACGKHASFDWQYCRAATPVVENIRIVFMGEDSDQSFHHSNASRSWQRHVMGLY